MHNHQVIRQTRVVMKAAQIRGDKRLDSNNQNVRKQFGSNDGRVAAPLKKKKSTHAIDVTVQADDECKLEDSYSLSDFYASAKAATNQPPSRIIREQKLRMIPQVPRMASGKTSLDVSAKTSALDSYAKAPNHGSFLMQQCTSKFRDYGHPRPEGAAKTGSQLFLRSGASIVADQAATVSAKPEMARNNYVTEQQLDPTESCPTVASADGEHGNFAQYMKCLPQDEDTAGMGRVGRELGTKGIGHVEMRPGLMKTGSDEAATNCRAQVERLLAQRKN